MDTNYSNDPLAEMLWDAVNGGVTLKDVHAIPDNMMESLYSHAYDFYNKGQLDQAATFFRFLCIYDFYNPDYYMGLGAVYQLQKQYQKAIDIYAVSFALSKDNYYSVFFSGQCQLLIQKANKAKQCFELVVNNCRDQALIDRAKVYLHTLNSPTVSETSSEEV